MIQLRIFSYMPNARVYKATIAARLCGVNVEILAALPLELKNWLWDFNARPLTEREKIKRVSAWVAADSLTFYTRQMVF